MTLDVGPREVVSVNGIGMPAFRVDMGFAGLHTRSWVTDTGEVVKEESPMGLMTVRENAQRAPVMSVGWNAQADLLEASAVVPTMKQRIAEPRDVRRIKVRLDGANLTGPHVDDKARRVLQGVGQTVEGNIVELRDPQSLRAGPADPDARNYLSPEPFIESDDPAVVAAAEAAVRGVAGVRARAERLTRHVNGMLEKKPTVSLPSAREVLRTKIGDCNEHTALYVAMARAIGIPARIAVGLTYMRGAFYYHAWPEVYLDEGARPRATGCRSIPRSISFRPTRRTCGSRAAASTGRRPSCRSSARMKMDGRRLELAPELDAGPGRARAPPTWRRWRSRCRSAPSAGAGPACSVGARRRRR